MHVYTHTHTHIYMYIFTLTHTCLQNTNNIICTHKNIHKIYNILIKYVQCTLYINIMCT